MNWFTLSPDEWNAVRLSVKVATVAMLALAVGEMSEAQFSRWLESNAKKSRG